jgi:hypothetical protein
MTLNRASGSGFHQNEDLDDRRGKFSLTHNCSLGPKTNSVERINALRTGMAVIR